MGWGGGSDVFHWFVLSLKGIASGKNKKMYKCIPHSCKTNCPFAFSLCAFDNNELQYSNRDCVCVCGGGRGGGGS